MTNGGAWPCALNAADEVAVAAFLERQISFLGISEVVEAVLSRTAGTRIESMGAVLAADQEARRTAREEVTRLAAKGVTVSVS